MNCQVVDGKSVGVKGGGLTLDSLLVDERIAVGETITG